jgi:hypothetical protein
MVFKGFRSNLSEDEVKELLGGMTPTELKAKLEQITSLQGDMTTVKDKINTLDSIQNTLTDLSTKLTARHAPKEDEGGGGTPKEEEEGTELDFLAEPEKSVQSIVDKAIGPVKGVTVAIYGEMNYNTFKASNPRGFNKYEKEIRAEFDKQPPAARANPKLIENIYKIVLADHIDDIAKEPNTFFVETGTSKPNNTTEPVTKKPEELLSPGELKQAEIWGMTPAQWAAEKGKLNYA